MMSQNESPSWVPKRGVEVLPIGVSIVSNAEPLESKPKQYGVGLPTKPQRVWYIVYQELSPVIVSIAGRDYQQWRTSNRWEFCYTKNEAIRIAKRIDGEGHKIVDVFRGTKLHISNKYEGLRYIRNKGVKNE